MQIFKKYKKNIIYIIYNILLPQSFTVNHTCDTYMDDFHGGFIKYKYDRNIGT